MLIDSLLSERERAKQKFFQKIVDKVEEPMEGIDFGPIQTVFKENLRGSLFTYQAYLDT